MCVCVCVCVCVCMHAQVQTLRTNDMFMGYLGGTPASAGKVVVAILLSVETAAGAGPLSGRRPANSEVQLVSSQLSEQELYTGKQTRVK